MTKISVEAPAKINLILNIVGKRPDGYHELETIMHQISLLDIIHMELSSSNIIVESNSELIPNGEDNLAYKAAVLFMEVNGLNAGVKIYIEKNIPVGAGLAGGSTDAAAVLSGLNRLLGAGLTTEKLQEIGAEIGSDVPFCLGSSTALATGRGEVITPVERGPELALLLVVPDFQISTAEVYGSYKMEKNCAGDIAAFVKAWQSYDIINISKHIHNELENVSIKKHNEINFIKENLKKLGAVNALMSGSGPGVFGIFPDQDTARKAAGMMQKRYEQVFAVTSYYRSD